MRSRKIKCVSRSTIALPCASMHRIQIKRWRLATDQWPPHGLTLSDIVVYRSFDLGEAPLHIIPTTGSCTRHKPQLDTPASHKFARVSLALTWLTYCEANEATFDPKLITHVHNGSKLSTIRNGLCWDIRAGNIFYTIFSVTQASCK